MGQNVACTLQPNVHLRGRRVTDIELEGKEWQVAKAGGTNAHTAPVRQQAREAFFFWRPGVAMTSEVDAARASWCIRGNGS